MGFRVWVAGSRFRSGFRGWVVGFRVLRLDVWSGVEGLGFRLCGLGFGS